MKKNKFMRLASFMLIACLATCCAVGGTFAKYVTRGEAADTARVAKWGVTVAVTGNGAAFSTTEGTEPNCTVKSLDTNKVVAPGTAGTLFTADISGKPEVAVNVAVDFTLTLTGWEVAGAEYMPLVFTINTVTYGLTGMKNEAGAVVTNAYSTIAELIAAVKEEINTVLCGEDDGNANFYANKDFGGAGSDLTVTWEWAFDGNNDDNDTALGNLATAPTIGFDLEIIVTQID